MVGKMNFTLVAGFVLIVVLCAVSAHPSDLSANFRTYPQPRPDCRSGLCPPPKRLVPTTTGHGYGYSSRSHEEYGDSSLCGNLCTADRECPENQKCCPTTCGYACQNIMHLSD